MTTLSLYAIADDNGDTIRYLAAPAAIPDEHIEAMLADGEYIKIRTPLVEYLGQHLDAPLSSIAVPELKHIERDDGSQDIDFGSGRVHLWIESDNAIGVRILTGDDYWRRYGRPLEAPATGRYSVTRDDSPGSSRLHPFALIALVGIAALAILILVL